ncbi:YqaJ-like viral recombinase domain protein [Fadolivirus algeromassiliense]|jgi:putative phage-type endonuclease|uniref:YqaJ-like viral recombinase domain protein n=1 Tax=Fadolivirus FV1/VV64 TaxID=3070911 RepID=A0A7D3UST8_9VIRU|nr:YqaJ-like viral recombinase domain protein [Fadolivirus algeromassiliense]QKF93790.1 YqaJ-like viral recombinase domain protein [Fadolivirus FV1/VV64]
MTSNKYHEKKIKDLIKVNHDGKLYQEHELNQVVNTIVLEIKKDVDLDEDTITTTVSQYLYCSKEGKYYFNFKRRQTKKKEYHNKILSTVKDSSIKLSPTNDSNVIIIENDNDTIEPTSDDLEALENEIFKKATNNKQGIKEIQQEISSAKQIVKIVEVEPQKINDYTFPPNIPFKLTKRINDIYGPFGTQWCHDDQFDDPLDEKVIEYTKRFDILRAIKSPDQRTPDWYALRDGKITASDGGTVLDLNSHEPQYKFILKKTIGLPFLSNEFVHHGKKYEEIATLIYEYRMNITTEEFGLIGHPVHNFLGASPDRIAGRYKLDGKHLSKYVGRMLEIKCPYVRQIKMSGAIIDNICPIYYWIQVQLQLECCNLDECDFWQTEIREYESRQEFIEDTDPNEPFRSIKTKFEKGCVIQLLPKKRMTDVIEGKYKNVVEDDSMYIYPPKIEMSPYDCDIWIAKMITEMNNNPKYKDYFFDKVIYWKLVTSKNVLINRDRKWFADNYPKLKQVWDYVLFFRANKDKLQILVDYIESREKKKNKEIMEVVSKICNPTDPNYDKYIDNINKDIIAAKVKKETKQLENGDDDYMFIDPGKQAPEPQPKKYNPYAKSFGQRQQYYKKNTNTNNNNDDDYMFIN